MIKQTHVIMVSLLALLAAYAGADNSVKPANLETERPTLICLGFEWEIDQDDNNNATATVEYRQSGSDAWKQGMDLVSMHYNSTLSREGGKLDEAREVRALAGSILDLEPGTEYEVRLTMQDPDGVTGEAVREMKLATRPEPKPFEGGEVRHVYPPEYKGEKEEPAYKSLTHAVNGYHTWCDEYQTVHKDAAPAGTIIKMHAGTYAIDRENYREHTQLWLHGTYVFIPDGTPEKPIAIVAAGDGEVIIDGMGCYNLFNVQESDYLYFEGLTIRNTNVAFYCGFQGHPGTKGLTVKNCNIENIAWGVMAHDGDSEDFYIADNRFIGMNPDDKFNPRSGGAWGKTEAGYAVNLSGKGHVVCYNYAANFWDGYNVFTGALSDPGTGQVARGIDIYNNEITNSTDNFIEADGGLTNIRILRNRCFNCMAVPLSVQPVYAGPVYYIRNIVFNAGDGQCFKLASGANAFFYNNTVDGFPRMDFVRNERMLNNIFAGPGYAEPGKKSTAMNAVGDDGAVRDYNAYRIIKPIEGLFTVGSRNNKQSFSSLKELAAKTGFETHGLTFQDYSIFQKADEPTHGDSNQDPLVDPSTVNLELSENAPMIDKGIAIPNVTDQYKGDAPDMGAFESGMERPHFGPRR